MSPQLREAPSANGDPQFLGVKSSWRGLTFEGCLEVERILFRSLQILLYNIFFSIIFIISSSWDLKIICSTHQIIPFESFSNTSLFVFDSKMIHPKTCHFPYIQKHQDGTNPLSVSLNPRLGRSDDAPWLSITKRCWWFHFWVPKSIHFFLKSRCVFLVEEAWIKSQENSISMSFAWTERGW